MVSAVADEDPLTLKIARGTGVLDRHEASIVDLCLINGSSDSDVENCVVDYLAMGYDDSVFEQSDEEMCNEEDDECLINDMMNMWAEDLPAQPLTGITDKPEKETMKKVKPWSSRSSPSGTFVRDPVTGQMRNIDETEW